MPSPIQKENRRRLRTRIFQVLFTCFTIATILFIFSNSMEIAQVSSGKSAAVTEFLNKILRKLGFGLQLTEHRVRKLAHFTEYAMLGFWLMLTLRVYTRRILTHIFFPLFMGLFIPVADETLQLFVSGRSGEVKDVLIDFSGVLVGLFCALFLLLLVRMLGILIKNKAEL